MSAQREVIRRFMASLDKTPFKGTDALDAAVRACSDFGGIDELIDQFISDCENAESADDFLKTYCGIDLDNEDTGAITGADAGGDTVKTAESIVEESGEAGYPEGTSFVVNGLTINVPEQSELTDAQQRIVRGLYSWWMSGAFDLINESYGDNYGFDDSGSATVKELTIEFVDRGSFLAQSGHRYKIASGKATALTLQINMSYYRSIAEDDVDGTSNRSNAAYLDRTLAHEMTHAVMAANINYFSELPAYLKEGMSEITHGIDDTRTKAITTLAGNATKLRAAFTTSVSPVTVSGVTGASYAAGYMLLRYLAKQSAATVYDRAENYAYIALTDGDDSLANYEDEITIAAGAGDDTINNYANHVVIEGGAGDDLITIGGSDVTIVSSSGADTLTSYAVTDVIKLDDTSIRRVTVDEYDLILETYDGSLTLIDAADADISIINRNDELIIKNFSAETLDGGNGTIYNADGLKITQSKTKLTVGDPYEGLIDMADFSSKLKTIDARKCTGLIEVEGNDKNNVIRAGSGGSTLSGGAGNDKLYGGDGADVFVYDGQGKDIIYNYASDDRIVIDGEIDSVKVSGSTVKLLVDDGILTIKKAVGMELALTDADGQTNYYIFDKNHKTLETALTDHSTDLYFNGRNKF